MKINKAFLSIPPYLSTSWEHVAALRLQGTDLIVTLTCKEDITIPNLKPEVLEVIFHNHAAALEERLLKEKSTTKPATVRDSSLRPSNHSEETLFKIGIGAPEGIQAAMQHNPELADSPDLPPEVLGKISAISKIIAPENVLIPKAEPHCNCPYCQIAKAMHSSLEEVHEETEQEAEEEVSEEELRFQEWEIIQSGDKLFTVVNKLDSHEKYSVYLGHPVGCTCGKEGCEHILAVLKS